MIPHKNFIVTFLEFFAVVVSSSTWLFLINQTLQIIILIIAGLTGLLGLGIKYSEYKHKKKKPGK